MTTHGRRVFRVGASAAAVLLALALLPASARAHAKLLRSQPAAGSTAEQSPKLVELWFNEELEPNLNTVEVKDARGARVDQGDVTIGEGGKKIQVALGELTAGTYAVEWKAVSADGHTIRGRFNFTVAGGDAAIQSQSPSPKEPAQTTGVAATPSPRAQSVNAADESPITWADSFVRWLGYMAMMTLFGGFAARLFVLGHALRHMPADEETGGDAATAAARRTLLLLWAGVIVLFVSLLASLVLQSAEVFGGGPAEAASRHHLVSLISGTGFGRSWLLQTVVSAALLVITFLLGRSVKDERTATSGAALWWAGLVAAAVLLYGPVMTGHAAAAAREFALSSVSDWLHLVAAGFWVGGLFHLALTLPPALSRLDGVARARALGRVITLFTRLAVPSVVILLLAGLYNSWTHVASLRELWDTPYGRMLLIKVLLVLPMLALGAFNGFRLGPRASRLAAGDSPSDAGVERGFIRSVKTEALLGALVLLATAALVFTTPARGHAAGDTRINPNEVHGGK